MMTAQDVLMMQQAVTGAGYFVTPCQIARAIPVNQGSPAVGWQVVSSAGLLCRIVPDSGQYEVMPGVRFARLHAWSLRFPLGTDVHNGDRVIALGESYTIVEVRSPQTVAVYIPTTAVLLGPVGTDGLPTDATFYLQPNATITLSRQNGVVPAGGSNRRVRLEDPSPTEQIMPSGAQVAQLLYDAPGAPYVLGDVVSITQVDGHSGVPAPNKYTVGEVDFIPAPWPLVRVQLEATKR